MIRKVLIQKSHMLFSSNASTRDFALGKKHPTVDHYLKEFRTLKPCVHSSEAHSFAELFQPDESRFTWIKADPTFKGLLQTLNEPDTRVFIGAIPPGLEAARSRPTKIVRELGIHKKAGSTLSEKWFDHQLPLNPELIAIIGNKGSGKSALADILGLIGNTPRYEAFSFLSPDRFKDRRNNKAKHFEATATWGDEKVDGPISLDEIPAKGPVETIKYIPQDYLETICNEVSLGSGSKFYEELQGVIFSHVPEAEQLGFSSLDDLLMHRSEETKKSIDLLVDQLRAINRELVACEGQLTDTHRKSLDAQLAAKQREIEAHDLTKPPDQAQPSEDPAVALAAAEVTAQIRTLENELGAIDGHITEARQKLGEATKRRTVAERLLGKLANVEKQVRASSNDAQSEVTELGLRWADLVKLEVDKAPVDGIIQQATGDATRYASLLDPRNEQGLIARQKHCHEADLERNRTPWHSLRACEFVR